VSSEKLLAVAYSLAAFISGTVGVKVMGVVAGDGLLMLVGVLLCVAIIAGAWTMDQNDDAEEEARNKAQAAHGKFSFNVFIDRPFINSTIDGFIWLNRH